MKKDNHFETKQLPTTPDVIAPDGSDVRILLTRKGGSMAHFELAPDHTSIASCNQTVEEIWYIVGGQGEMWRKRDGQEEVVALSTGVCITIPNMTHFQFRALGTTPLQAVAITMPPWPGEGEGLDVAGIWAPKITA